MNEGQMLEKHMCAGYYKLVFGDDNHGKANVVLVEFLQSSYSFNYSGYRYRTCNIPEHWKLVPVNVSELSEKEHIDSFVEWLHYEQDQDRMIGMKALVETYFILKDRDILDPKNKKEKVEKNGN